MLQTYQKFSNFAVQSQWSSQEYQQKFPHRKSSKFSLRKGPQKRRVATVPQTIVPVEEAEQNSVGQEGFSWTKQWYPIQILIHLDDKRPTSVQLLGKDLVLWKNGEGNWVCFEDQCPHRLVPLSEGRLETDGTLQCSYHGWRFNGKGECVKIPQAETELAENLCSNKRACAKVHPTMEKYGLLWIWGESGTNSKFESQFKSPNVPDVLDTIKFDERDWQARNLPYSHETFVENVVDPAHLAVSHHGMQGQNRNYAKPMYCKIIEPMHAYKGFKFRYPLGKQQQNSEKFFRGVTVQFLPPTVVYYNANYAKHFVLDMLLLSTPMTRGECRLFQIFIYSGKKGIAARIINKFKPKFLFHLSQNIFLQQDACFLFRQEKTIDKLIQNKNTSKNITSEYYMPTIEDIGVNELHKWLTMHAQGGVQYSPQMVPRERTVNDLIDTYNSRTKICTYCMGALQNFQRLQIVAWIACAICATCAICSVLAEPFVAVNMLNFSVYMPAIKAFVFGVFSLVFAVIGNFAKKWVAKFYITEFSHADT